MRTGIYQIRNLTNGKSYIGSAAGKGFCNRWGTHLKQLKDGRHNNTYLQRAWNKYGADVFVFEILEECEPMQCIEREQYYLDTLLFASHDDQRFKRLGYNILRIAGSTLGYKHSEKTKAKMRRASLGQNLGKRHTQECKDKISHALQGNQNAKGAVRSEQERQRISKLHKGKTVSAETRHKVRLANSRLTERQVMKIRSMLHVGKTQQEIATLFDVSRKTISNIKLGKRWSNV
jgi:group I intron endonuclease